MDRAESGLWGMVRVPALEPVRQCPVLACCFTDKKRQVTAHSEHYYAGKSWRAISMSKTVRFKLKLL
eukprot:scaffold268_cov247-Chaetoceros_neogracile.AAC.1